MKRLLLALLLLSNTTYSYKTENTESTMEQLEELDELMANLKTLLAHLEAEQNPHEKLLIKIKIVDLFEQCFFLGYFRPE